MLLQSILHCLSLAAPFHKFGQILTLPICSRFFATITPTVLSKHKIHPVCGEDIQACNNSCDVLNFAANQYPHNICTNVFSKLRICSNQTSSYTAVAQLVLMLSLACNIQCSQLWRNRLGFCLLDNWKQTLREGRHGLWTEFNALPLLRTNCSVEHTFVNCKIHWPDPNSLPKIAPRDTTLVGHDACGLVFKTSSAIWNYSSLEVTRRLSPKKRAVLRRSRERFFGHFRKFWKFPCWVSQPAYIKLLGGRGVNLT